MKILFIGTVEFSRRFLLKLVDLEADVVGVITKLESDFNADYAALSPICEKYNIPYRYTDNINSQKVVSWIEDLSPDIIFCFGWSWIIGKRVRNLAPILGFHPAQLPKNRGRHPLIWALALGLKVTASTFFFMDSGVDNGEILSQVKVPISYHDDAKRLYDKIGDVALKQVEEFLPKLEAGTYTSLVQDSSLANYWRLRSESDGEIDFRMSSENVYNLVRALSTPYIGAHVVYKGAEVKVWQVSEKAHEGEKNIEPGKVLEVHAPNVLVKCGRNTIWLLRHDFTKLPQVGEYL